MSPDEDNQLGGLLRGLFLFALLIGSALVFARRREVPRTRSFGEAPRTKREHARDRYWVGRTAGGLIGLAAAGVIAVFRAELPVVLLVPICLLAAGFSVVCLSALQIWPFNKER